VILLLNRRGFANYLCCSNAKCGYVLTCEQCDASMVLHVKGAGVVGAAAEHTGGTPVPRDGGRGRLLRCHHCLAQQLMPRECPVGGSKILPLGQGTQRVEDELIRKFGAACGLEEGKTLLRVEGDTMRTGTDFFDALSRFAAGEVRVLLGTQMIAKGLDFPRVR